MSKARLEKFYENIVCEDFVLLYNFESISNFPNFDRLVLNSTSGSFNSSSIVVMQSFGGWLIGTSQKCIKTRARKSIALFNVRKNNLLGLKVTARKSACFALLDKLLIWVLPQLFPNSVRSKTGAFLLDNKEKGASSISAASKKNLIRNKSFFTISHHSSHFFPEISNLDLFFDKGSGFALSCSLVYGTKNRNPRFCFRRRRQEVAIGESNGKALLAYGESNNPRFFSKKENNVGSAISVPTLYHFMNGVNKKTSSKASQYCDAYLIKRQFISAFQYLEQNEVLYD